jgi:hypothetical protein
LNPRPRAYESPALPLSYSGKSLNINGSRLENSLLIAMFEGRTPR